MCDHFEEKMSFTGIQSTIEIDEALKQGYKILKIYEIMHFILILLVEGIFMEKANIKYNQGMRMIAKLCLNSFWGRFGMSTNKPQ